MYSLLYFFVCYRIHCAIYWIGDKSNCFAKLDGILEIQIENWLSHQDDVVVTWEPNDNDKSQNRIRIIVVTYACCESNFRLQL